MVFGDQLYSDGQSFVYLKAYRSVAEARSGIGEYFEFYNTERKHQTLGMTPDQKYFEENIWLEAA